VDHATAFVAGVVGKLQLDRPGGEYDEGQGGVGGVETVGPPDEEADFGIERLHPTVEDAALDGLRIMSRLAPWSWPP